jgi:hypothetical protein
MSGLSASIWAERYKESVKCTGSQKCIHLTLNNFVSHLRATKPPQALTFTLTFTTYEAPPSAHLNDSNRDALIQVLNCSGYCVVRGQA